MNGIKKKIKQFLGEEKLTVDQQKLVFQQQLVVTATANINLEKIIYPMVEQRNLLLIGDAGIGKNALIYYINEIRNLPTIRFSFNQDTLPEDLIGSYKILPDGFHWQNGPLVEAMVKGYVFVADEMNLASPEILKRFLSVLENRSLTLLEKDSATVKAHPRFLFVATQNPTRGFEGRKILPESIRKIFTVLNLDGYDLEEEQQIIQELYPQIEKKWIKFSIELQQNIERKIWVGELAKDDLEHYHFNLRTLQRLWTRIQNKKIKHQNWESIKREIYSFYVNCFNLTKDREIILNQIAEGLNFPIEKVLQDYEFYTMQELSQEQSSKLFVSVNHSDVNTDEEVFQIDPLPLTRKRVQYLSQIYSSLKSNENLLLEGDDSVRLSELVLNYARHISQAVTTIYLSKGMHTSDILGALRPVEVGGNKDTVRWVDGPLTRAIKNGHWVIFENIEAAGSELIEKLNMLLDHAQTLVLPPEAEGETVLKRKNDCRIIAIKRKRISRNTTTISRAFRNRFFSMILKAVTNEDELLEALQQTFSSFSHDISMADVATSKNIQLLLEKMVQYHLVMNSAIEEKKIAVTLAEKIQFREENILRWLMHILFWTGNSKPVGEPLDLIVRRGIDLHYLSLLNNKQDREFGIRMWQRINQEIDFEAILKELKTGKKKILNERSVKRKLTWDPKKHWRPANTGKAKLGTAAKKLKKGININTPETGGKIKEGKDAWYGKDTQGNKGEGEPAGGGGAWGVRTEELFRAFLENYKPKWDYSMPFTLHDYYDTFSKMLDSLQLDFDIALDSNLEVERLVSTQGYRVDIRRYLSYKANLGSDRIFDQSKIHLKDDVLKGLEFVFLINKGRRIFNFDYCVASVVALQSAIEILLGKKIAFKVLGYSDFDNFKESINIVDYWNYTGQDYAPSETEDCFDHLTKEWHGDTVEEYEVLSQVSQHFSPDAKTKMVVMVSDFRGHRAKQKPEAELNSYENTRLHEIVNEFSSQNYNILGMQVGPRNLAQSIFQQSICINGDNFHQAPILLADKLKKMITRYHQV